MRISGQENAEGWNAWLATGSTVNDFEYQWELALNEEDNEWQAYLLALERFESIFPAPQSQVIPGWESAINFLWDKITISIVNLLEGS